jgi:hypothetical protein
LSKEGQPGRDQSNAHSEEQGRSHKEGAGGTHHLSHEQLVKGFRDYIQKEQPDPKSPWYVPPAETIRRRLKWGERDPRKSVPEERRFFYELKIAWDILAYEHLESHSPSQMLAVYEVEEFYKYNPKPTLKLSDTQIRVIDALTEACDIPHKRGQAEITIPEKLRDFNKWIKEHPNDRLDRL